MTSTVVPIYVTADALAYIQALLNGGLMRGTAKKKIVNPKLKPLIDAVYQVLAGGTVRVAVIKPGDPGQLKTYRTLHATSLDSINEISGTQPKNTVKI